MLAILVIFVFSPVFGQNFDQWPSNLGMMRRLRHVKNTDWCYTTDPAEVEIKLTVEGFQNDSFFGLIAMSKDPKCPTLTPLYRMQNVPKKDHFLSTSKDQVRAMAKQPGWWYRGVLGYCVPNAGQCGANQGIHQFFHPQEHLFVADENEKNIIIGKQPKYFSYENIVCYIWKT